jgi:hypothetical protein
MRTARFLRYGGAAALGIAVYLIAMRGPRDAQKSAAVKIKAADIGGVVTNGNGRGGALASSRFPLPLLAPGMR